MPLPEGSVLVSAYVPHDLVAAFKARAEAEDRSVSATVKRAMRAYLANDERAAGQGDALTPAFGRRPHEG